MSTEVLGTFEQWVLMALIRLRDRAYGRNIHDELEQRLERNVPIGQVYVTLGRLEEKGMVSSTLGDSTPIRGGRAKRLFSITGAGELAVRESLRSVDSLRTSAGVLGAQA